MDIRMWLAGAKQRFTRGSNYVSIIISILVITANIKLFEGFITPLLPGWFKMQWLYVVAIVGYPVVCWLVGYIDQYWGIWNHENNWTFYTSPWSQEILTAARITIRENENNKK
jgi:hypothetical protein